ncbi:MAG: sigma-54 interaction domain-containing protein [Vicinamibacterales bacterium]
MVAISAELTGKSPKIQALQEDIELAARSDAKVLITGESGTGKEIAARLIHASSLRRARPLVAINCAGIPETLLESELFGHERGSFTGAVRDRGGLLEAGHRGTAFLDEVGEMTLRMQGTLLRFLENGEIQRVGSDRRQAPIDVRIIAATNRNLLDRVATSDFRLDLYYRLNVIHLTTPALRERPEDIPLLLERFIEQYTRTYRLAAPRFSHQALEAFCAYDWPGNVRELKNVAERLVITRAGRQIGPADLPFVAGPSTTVAAAPVPPSGTPVPDNRIDSLVTRMIKGGESFWSVVYEPFMARDLTRDDVRGVIRRGLEESRGSYKVLMRSFNLEERDYKRVLNFLRKHECHVAFQPYRTGVAFNVTKPILPPSRVSRRDHALA